MDANETKIFITILIAAVVLAVIVIFFIITIIRHQKRSVQLYKEKIKAEINTLEAERKRMARDLHDDIGPILSIVEMQLSSVKTTNDTDKQTLTIASKHIHNTLLQIREISYNLLPGILEWKGLAEAVGEFVNHINDTHTIKIIYTYPRVVLSIKKETEIHLYRTIKEIVHNALKHAGATQITITLIQEAKNYC